MDEQVLRSRLARVTDWFHATEHGLRHCSPPMNVVRDIRSLESWPFPRAVGITQCPVLRSDGSILTTPGYDPRTRLIYTPSADLLLPAVSNAPTDQEVGDAVAMLLEAFGDFPFADRASYAHALALLISLVARPAIAGQVPLAQ